MPEPEIPRQAGLGVINGTETQVVDGESNFFVYMNTGSVTGDPLLGTASARATPTLLHVLGCPQHPPGLSRATPTPRCCTGGGRVGLGHIGPRHVGRVRLGLGPALGVAKTRDSKGILCGVVDGNVRPVVLE